jgi:hypothetical protein
MARFLRRESINRRIAAPGQSSCLRAVPAISALAGIGGEP